MNGATGGAPPSGGINATQLEINGVSVGAGATAVTPEQYGAVGNGNSYFDGVTSASSLAVASNGSTSVTPSAPTVTTTQSNDVVLALYQLSAVWGTPPAVGTNRVNVGFVSGKYGLYANDQTIASAGSVAAVTGTVASSTWNAGTVALVPASGQTISFVNASSVVQISGSSLTLPAPTGLANGMTEVVCFLGYIPGSFSWPNGFLKLFSLTTSSYYFDCRWRTAYNDPASYVFSGIMYGSGAYALAYSNVARIDGQATLTSATAGFTSTEVGDPICIANSASSTTQACGQIVGYTSATSVTVGFPIASTGSSKQFAFGTADDTAFNTMLTTAPCSTTGCTIQLQPHRYVLTKPLTLSPNIPVALIGAGAAVPNTENDFINGDTAPNSNNGTMLMFLTQHMGAAGITISGGSVGHTSGNVTDRIAHFSIYGGVGSGRDGGGADGIDIINWQNFIDEDVYKFNFSGNCVGLGSLALSSSDYLENITLDHHFESWCGGNGIYIGAGTYEESIAITNGIMENSGGAGLSIASSAHVQGLTISNNVSQWNNISAAGPEFYSATLNITGCTITGVYFENGVGGSQSNAAFNNNLYPPRCSFDANHFSTATWTLFNSGFSYSAAGTPVPACDGYMAGTPPITVSDATALTPGTAYTTGGGSDIVLLQCAYTGSAYGWQTL